MKIKLSSRLRDALRNQEVDKKALVDMIDVRPATLRNWVRNRTLPTLSNFYRLCNALDISADYLLGLGETQTLAQTNEVIESSFGAPTTTGKFNSDVFVVLPHDEEFPPIYQDAIRPICEDLGYSVKRSNSVFNDTKLLDDVWSGLYYSKVLVADCTERSANVFFSVGIAHTIGKPTILLTQNKSDVPFEEDDKPIVFYENKLSIKVLNKLKDDLKVVLEETLGAMNEESDDENEESSEHVQEAKAG